MEVQRVTPKHIPVKCVVCGGYGTVNYGKKECHGCQGRGYILVPPMEEKDGKHRVD